MPPCTTPQVQHTPARIPEVLGERQPDHGRSDTSGRLARCAGCGRPARWRFPACPASPGARPTPLQVLSLVALVLRPGNRTAAAGSYRSRASSTCRPGCRPGGPAALGIGLAWWAFCLASAAPAAPTVQAVLMISAASAWRPASRCGWSPSLPNVLRRTRALIGAIAHGWIKAPVFSGALVLLGVLCWRSRPGRLARGHFARCCVSPAGPWRAAVFALVLLAATGLYRLAIPGRTWQADYASAGRRRRQPARLQLSQETFETQQALMESTMAAIAPRAPRRHRRLRPGVCALCRGRRVPARKHHGQPACWPSVSMPRAACCTWSTTPSTAQTHPVGHAAEPAARHRGAGPAHGPRATTCWWST